NFAPRIGVSYAVTPKTVLRGGYGIYYMLFERFGSEDQLALNAPFIVNNVQSAPSTASAPLFLLQDGFPANSLDPNQPGLLSLVRRFKDGFSLRFSYTYSRSVDNTPQELETNSGSAPNGRNYSSWFGPSDFDTPHRFVASYVYELALGRNRQFVKEGILSYII